MLQRSISSSGSCSDDASIASGTLELPSVAICGTCSYVRCMARALKAAGFPITFVWDQSSSAAEALAQELQVEKWTTQEDVLLRDPAVCLVVVWTAPSIQTLIFDKAIGMGKSAICGLPVAVDHVTVRRMRSAIEKNPLLFMVGQCLRFLPSVMKAKTMVREGRIGSVRLCTVRLTCAPLTGDHFDWRCDNVMGGGVLARFGSLVVDLLHHITALKIVKVSGMLKTFNRQTEEICGIRQITADDFCVFEFENEISPACGVVTLNASDTNQDAFSFEMIIQGTSGRLRLCGTELHHLTSNVTSEQLIVSDPMTKSDYEKVMGSADENLIPSILCKGFIHMANALKVASNERTTEPLEMGASFEDWKYVQRIIDTIKRSAEAREWCPVRRIH